jgi:Tfx family DNA-binding protein
LLVPPQRHCNLFPLHKLFAFSKTIKHASIGMKEKENKTFLTDKQIAILKMKKEGMSQADIARIKKTTRGNVCIIEKSALRNIERANNTIKFYKALEAPISLTIPEGTDLYDIPKKIFEPADKKGIKISADGAMIVVKLKTELRHKMRGRLITDDIEISADENGNLTIN